MRRDVVLMLHKLSDDESGDFRQVSPSMFESVLQELRERGYSFVQLDEILERGHSQTRKENLCAVTSDDGYKTDALLASIVEKFNFRATFFINPGTIGSPGFLDVDDVIELDQRGHSVQSHGQNHVNMSSLQGNELVKQILEANVSILEMIGKKPKYFAYPFGRQTRSVRVGVKRNEISYAFSAHRGLISRVNHPYYVPRFGLSRESTPISVCAEIARSIPSTHFSPYVGLPKIKSLVKRGLGFARKISKH